VTRGDILALAAILAVAATLTLHWAPISIWTPDSLFYQAKVEQIRGASEDDALTDVWEGPLATGFRLADQQRPPESRVLSDPAWITYSAQFYDRRIVVPLMAAAIHPLAGTNSLEVVSIVGCFVFALLLYVLLRQRFGPLACGIAVILCLAWPPTRWAFLPLTESWGLALICLALLSALLAIERGGGWFAVWGVAVLALSFTRDLTPVALAAVALLLLALRNREAVLLTGIGLAAAVPAPLIGGAPLREHLAYSYNSSRIPDDPSWGFVADRYFTEIGDGIRGNFEYIFSAHPRFLDPWLPLLPFTVPIVAGIVVIIIARAWERDDAFLPLMRGALLGGVAYYLLLPHFNYLRYELVFLPAAAGGMAMGIEFVSRWMRAGPPGPPSDVPPARSRSWRQTGVGT
jgi:hypothetical protein